MIYKFELLEVFPTCNFFVKACDKIKFFYENHLNFGPEA